MQPLGGVRPECKFVVPAIRLYEERFGLGIERPLSVACGTSDGNICCSKGMPHATHQFVRLRICCINLAAKDA